MTTKENRETFKEQFSVVGLGWGFIAFLIVWFLLGFIAFIYSIVCFGKSGTGLEKTIGLLLSIFLGPFYWIYFWAVKGYCK